jgi:hypothetical protein
LDPDPKKQITLVDVRFYRSEESGRLSIVVFEDSQNKQPHKIEFYRKNIYQNVMATYNLKDDEVAYFAYRSDDRGESFRMLRPRYIGQDGLDLEFQALKQTARDVPRHERMTFIDPAITREEMVQWGFPAHHFEPKGKRVSYEEAHLDLSKQVLSEASETKLAEIRKEHIKDTPSY